jgi:uncharacterized protein (TIGR03118 family)
MKIINTSNILHVYTITAAIMLFSIHLSAQAEDRQRKFFYQQTNLVSDQAGKANNTDVNLKNPWGIAFNPNGFVWIANASTGTSTLYDGNGTPAAALPVVKVPGVSGNPGNPTGIVFNASTTDFNGSPFIFANESGSLAAWNPAVDRLNAQPITTIVPAAEPPVYKGLALAATSRGSFLYATDFHNANVQVFDSTFAWVDAKKTLGCDFTDPKIPAGFAPFGIQNINGALFVTYAKQDADRHDDVAGKGLGYVNKFDANGCLVRRFASRGHLNAPWGLAVAPGQFGKHGKQLLIGNFGDGVINAYGLARGKYEDALRGRKGKKIVIDGLWGLAFGNGINAQPTQSLFFTAGPNNEANGLYGKLEAVKVKRGNSSGGGSGNPY